MAVIADRLADVRAQLDRECLSVGREPGEVRLLPVSKTHPVEAVRDALAAGYREFGESRPQELQAKAVALGDTQVRWVMIGQLQRNKAKLIVEHARELQSLASVELATDLDRRLQAAGRSLDVLVQVNTSGEATKSGLAASEVAGFARFLTACDSLRVRGLMTIGARSDDRVEVERCFQSMQDLQAELRQAAIGNHSWDELSMGMSGDHDLAIARGATVVRIGSAIFGARSYA